MVQSSLVLGRGFFPVHTVFAQCHQNFQKILNRLFLRENRIGLPCYSPVQPLPRDKPSNRRPNHASISTNHFPGSTYDISAIWKGAGKTLAAGISRAQEQ
jgi:hypothetical protein